MPSKHPAEMTLAELMALHTVTRPLAGEKPVVIFFAHGSRWGVVNQSGRPEAPNWLAAWGGRDPLYPDGPDRIGE